MPPKKPKEEEEQHQQQQQQQQGASEATDAAVRMVFDVEPLGKLDPESPIGELTAEIVETLTRKYAEWSVEGLQEAAATFRRRTREAVEQDQNSDAILAAAMQEDAREYATAGPDARTEAPHVASAERSIREIRGKMWAYARVAAELDLAHRLKKGAALGEEIQGHHAALTEAEEKLKRATAARDELHWKWADAKQERDNTVGDLKRAIHYLAQLAQGPQLDGLSSASSARAREKSGWSDQRITMAG